MRVDHVVPGMRVVISGGKRRGTEGVVESLKKADPQVGQGWTSFFRASAKVRTDSGVVHEVWPRWMEPANG